MERQLLALINADRKANGVPEVRMNEALCAVARAHSRDMRDRSYFAHLTPEGRTPMERARAAGILCARMGENLAQAREITNPHRMMMAEPPDQPNHRRVLLNPAYSEVGIGIEAGGPWLYITEDFMAPSAADDAGAGSLDAPGAVIPGAEALAGALDAMSDRLARMNEKLGRISLLARDPKTALESFQEAVRRDPHCPGAQEGVGEAQEALGKPDEARDAYAKAVAANPDDATARLRLAELTFAAGKPAEAEPHYRALVRLQPGNAPAWYGAARCALAAGRKEEAREALQKACKLDAALRVRAQADAALAALLD